MSCNSEYIFDSVTRSRAEVASSKITRFGLLTKTLPNARRCCSPSDNVLLQSSDVVNPLIGSPSPARLASCPRSTESSMSRKS
mmetsp:Transcript_6071/g.8746  ORF Transcript_6071/g.8746 Transcript_6071/m.8746 type:complete len:83 (-) Transcript_6071:242-490(-)